MSVLLVRHASPCGTLQCVRDKGRSLYAGPRVGADDGCPTRKRDPNKVFVCPAPAQPCHASSTISTANADSALMAFTVLVGGEVAPGVRGARLADDVARRRDQFEREGLA